jgi:hypothetical protein
MPKPTLTYDSVHEAENRLTGTVVTYDGQPVQVTGVESHEDGVMRLYIREFPFNGAPVRKKINSPSFKRFQTPPLGYCNYFNAGSPHSLWCERLSPRSRRQGLCDEKFSATDRDGRRQTLARLQGSDAFREMIVGEYPAHDAVLDRLVPNSSIAVDRDFAFEMAPDGFTKLVWRRETIALVVRDGLFLRNDRQHLRETIADCRNLPNRVEVL